MAAPEMVWSKVKTTGYLPEGRVGATAEVVGRSIFVFGGLLAGKRVGSLLEFDCDSQRWSIVKAKGEAPSARCYHASFSIASSFYIQGGEVSIEELALSRSSRPKRVLRRCADDLHRFDAVTRTWSPVRARLAPLPCKSHCIALLNLSFPEEPDLPCALMFGGQPAGDASMVSDLHAFPTGDLPTNKTIWRKVEPTGPPPVPRYGHRIVSISATRAVVFGGCTNTGSFLNDMHLFNGRALSWERVAIHGQPPIARQGHTLSFVPPIPGKRPPSLIVFGGSAILNDQQHFPKDVFSFDLSSCVWSQVTVGYNYPAPRYGHSTVVFPGVSFPSLPSTMESTSSSSAAGAGAGSSGSGGADTGVLDSPSSHQLLVFGGMTTQYCAADLWKLRVRRRRSPFYDTEGVSGEVVGAESGSDDEDWIVESEPELVSGSESGDDPDDDTTVYTTSASLGLTSRSEFGRTLERGPMSPSAGLVSWKGGKGLRGRTEEVTFREKHDRSECQRVLSEMQTELIALRKHHATLQRRHAEERRARIAAESARDETQVELAATAAALTAAQESHARQEADTKEACEKRIIDADAAKAQAVADLGRVTHLLCLYDVAANLRVEGWKRQCDSLAESSAQAMAAAHEAALKAQAAKEEEVPEVDDPLEEQRLRV